MLDNLTNKFHEKPEIANLEHWVIANALENGDINLAIEKTRQHIKGVLEGSQKQIQNYFSENNMI